MLPKIGITMTEDTALDTKLRRGYYKVIAASGALPLGLPPLESHLVKPLLKELDGLLLAGGDDLHPSYYQDSALPETKATEPNRDPFEMALAVEAWQMGIPILAICRGMQLLNVALGGTLWQDAAYLTGSILEHQQTEPPEIAPQQLRICDPDLSKLLGAAVLSVNSHHHQMVRQIAPPLQAAAYSEDGVIEALSPCVGAYQGYCWAVQWHPERLTDAASKRLFSSFIAAAQEFALKKAKNEIRDSRYNN